MKRENISAKEGIVVIEMPGNDPTIGRRDWAIAVEKRGSTKGAKGPTSNIDNIKLKTPLRSKTMQHRTKAWD